MKKLNSYDFLMFPLEKALLAKIRKDIISQAQGKVLEIAFGTGVNMPYYNMDQISEIHALDISETMSPFPAVQYHILSAETLPFPDESFDSVVLTLGLCTIPNPEHVIAEIYRVLKPDGVYYFLEHQQAQSKTISKFFNFLNPFWKKHMGGCQINLQSHMLIAKKFNIDYNRRNIFYYGVAMKSYISR